MAKRIDEFFSVRAQRALVRAGIWSVAGIKRLTPDELRVRLKSKSAYRDVLMALGELSLRREPKSKG